MRQPAHTSAPDDSPATMLYHRHATPIFVCLRMHAIIFAAWKIGGKSWRLAAPVLQGTRYLNSCLIIVGANGKATFWAVAEETQGNSVFRYDQQ